MDESLEWLEESPELLDESPELPPLEPLEVLLVFDCELDWPRARAAGKVSASARRAPQTFPMLRLITADCTADRPSAARVRILKCQPGQLAAGGRCAGAVNASSTACRSSNTLVASDG